ncbi:hypothetical protein OIDMADRAFT_34244 [Oidiodendron maius Zn]|uniref:Uncharacterized protein n=1 Tax=Oidiodendron maius (strain Zn) TaxID=913774 RepID=A0A0C3GH87_OIDMZ|nr:hypothetical protein OIDMADRAFT_34244 [Oidiodendron maius Zn]
MIVKTVDSQNPHPFYIGPLDRQVLGMQAIALGDRNTNQTARLRTSADLNRPSDTQDWMPAITRARHLQKPAEETTWRLSGVDFSGPSSEQISKIMISAHYDTPVSPPNQCELYGSQVLAHLASADHEIHPHAVTYDRPQGTHDYCKTNPYEFDQCLGIIEIYQWDEKTQNFVNPFPRPLLRTRIPAGRSIEDTGAIGREVVSLGWLRSWKAGLRAFLSLLSILLLPRRRIANVNGRFGEIVEIWRS